MKKLDTRTNEPLLSVAEVEIQTGYARSTLYAAMSEGRFPKADEYAGRAPLWKVSTVNAWLRKHARHRLVHDGARARRAEGKK
jgi:predicted DNA-binding transcriptional regulator AlpA